MCYDVINKGKTNKKELLKMSMEQIKARLEQVETEMWLNQMKNFMDFDLDRRLSAEYKELKKLVA